MIEYKTGSIFDSKAQAIVNPVNEVGVMGAGLAKQFKERYPEMFESYKAFCDKGGFSRRIYAEISIRVRGDGTLSRNHTHFRLHWWSNDMGTNMDVNKKRDCVIINAPTKRHWRDKSDISTIKDILIDISSFCYWRRIETLAIPRLGCGLGGLDWGKVRPEIEEVFGTNSFGITREQPLVEVWSPV